MRDLGATTKGSTDDGRHAKVGAHATDVDLGLTEARESIDQQRAFGGCATDVEDHGRRGFGQKGSATGRVGSTGAKGEHWEAACSFGISESAVVSHEKQRRFEQAALYECPLQRSHGLLSQLAERCIEDGGVLPLQKTQRADIA